MANPLPPRPLLRSGIAVSETHYYRFIVNWMQPGSFEFTGDPIAIEDPAPIAEAAIRFTRNRGVDELDSDSIL